LTAWPTATWAEPLGDAPIVFQYGGYGTGHSYYTPPPQPVVHTTTVYPVLRPETLQVGGRYYQATLSGLRQYVDTLNNTNPDLFKTVDPELSSLESRSTTGLVVIIGGLAAGTALVVASFAAHSGKELFNAPLFYGGCGIGVVTPIVGFAMLPHEGSLLDFVNFHNEHASEHPIVWQGHTAQPLDDGSPPARSATPTSVRHAGAAESADSDVIIAKTDYPDGAAGFSFDASVADTQSTCETAHHEWKERTATEFSCSGTPKDIGEKAEATLTFCNDELCVIELTMHPKSAWSTELAGLLDTLTEKYGKPNRDPSGVPLECQAQLDACFTDGRVHKKAWWKFANHGFITVEAGKDGDLPASLRLRYQLKVPSKYRKKAGSFHDL
jgi:hypothetical protein